MDQFIENFVVPNKRARWAAVIAMKPRRWADLSFHDIAGSEVSLHRVSSSEDIIQSIGLASEEKEPALLFERSTCAALRTLLPSPSELHLNALGRASACERRR